VKALASISLPALAFAPAVSAETVARQTPEAGPVLAGEAVAWGDEGRDGAASRAAWAVEPKRRGSGAPARIVLREL